jgi:4-carboxymuconolactone decarboxylase
MFKEYPGRPYKIDPGSRTPEQQALVDRILAGPRKEMPPNLEIWLHNPAFAAVAEAFGAYVSKLSPMTVRAREIVILVTAAFLQSEFEWHWHDQFARKAGLGDEQILAIKDKRPARFDDPAEQITHELTVALLEHRSVDDALYQRAMRLLGHGGVADIVGLVGLYTMIALTIDFYRVPVETA